jgi:hypothetical protein
MIVAQTSRNRNGWKADSRRRFRSSRHRCSGRLSSRREDLSFWFRPKKALHRHRHTKPFAFQLGLHLGCKVVPPHLGVPGCLNRFGNPPSGRDAITAIAILLAAASSFATG